MIAVSNRLQVAKGQEKNSKLGSKAGRGWWKICRGLFASKSCVRSRATITSC